VVDTTTWGTLEKHDYLVKTGAEWNADAQRVHRIPETLVTRFGLPPAEVIGYLATSIRGVDTIVCHNLAFDKAVVLAEAQRLYEAGYGVKPKDIWSKPDFCTMVATKTFCAVPFAGGGQGFKFPKLNELYQTTFGRAYDVSGADLHDAANDAACLVSCVKELSGRGLLPGLVV
jgi:DNA polymerase III epsilon subunit-like protein